MIGRFIVLAAVAVSCSTALPFGSCGPWDSQVLGNVVGGQGHLISTGLNVPSPAAPMIETPAFPAHNILAPTNNIIPGNIIPSGVHSGLSFPSPTVSGPIVGGIQRFPGPVNFPFHGPSIIQSGPIHVPNIETRVPTIHARFPTVQRFQSIDAGISGFPTAGFPTAGVFPGASSPFPC